MNDRSRPLVGAVQAGLAAGPIVLLGFLALAWVAEPATSPLRRGDFDVVIGFAFLSLLYGFLPGFVVTLAAAWPLERLGHAWSAARSPILWALAGAALPFLVLLVVMDASTDMAIASPFIAAGLVCALIAWRQMHWPSLGD